MDRLAERKAFAARHIVGCSICVHADSDQILYPARPPRPSARWVFLLARPVGSFSQANK